MISVANLYLITPELFHDSSTSALLVAQGIAYLMAILRSTGILSSNFLDCFVLFFQETFIYYNHLSSLHCGILDLYFHACAIHVSLFNISQFLNVGYPEIIIFFEG